MVRDQEDEWKRKIEREEKIKIRNVEGKEIEKEMKKEREIERGFEGVKGKEIIEKEEKERMMEKWMGRGMNIDEIKVKRIVVVKIDENEKNDFEKMREEMKREIKDERLEDKRKWVERIVQMENKKVMVGKEVMQMVIEEKVMKVIFEKRGEM